MGGPRSKIRIALALAVLVAGPASADILVMRSAEGETFISNRGQRKGWKVVRRMKEFPGSSGLGLKGLRGGDSGQYDALIREAAESVNLDPHLVKAVVRAESNFQPRATSPKGAMGLMQLMPATAEQHGVKDAYDARDNVFGGVRHLSYLVDRYDGDVELVLAAYNAGTRPVDRVRGIPNYAETQYYVRRVQELRSFYSAGGGPTQHARPLKPAKPGELVAAIDWNARSVDEFYGKPLVFRGPGALRSASSTVASSATLQPAKLEKPVAQKLLGDEDRALRRAHLGIVGNEHELDPVLQCRVEPDPPNRSCHAPLRVPVETWLGPERIVMNDDPSLRRRR